MMTQAPVRITETFAVREVPGRSRGGRQIVETLEPLEYRVGSAEAGPIIVVPVGFETDFASIPWGVRNTFPPLGRHARAAIIHDFLYRVQGDLPRTLWHLQAPGVPLDRRVSVAGPMLGPPDVQAYLELTKARPEVNATTYTRAQADDIFREAMAVLGVSVWMRNLMHRAVRLGGGGGWGR